MVANLFLILENFFSRLTASLTILLFESFYFLLHSPYQSLNFADGSFLPKRLTHKRDFFPHQWRLLIIYPTPFLPLTSVWWSSSSSIKCSRSCVVKGEVGGQSFEHFLDFHTFVARLEFYRYLRNIVYWLPYPPVREDIILSLPITKKAS